VRRDERFLSLAQIDKLYHEQCFFKGFWKGVVVELQGANTIFPAMSDTFNSFSQKRKFPSKYA